jgi:MYXO-CTERM domain-containing protein
MKKTIALAAVAAIAGSAMAQDTLVIDVSGINSWGFQGDAQNEILNVLVGAGANITNIAWDVNLTTLDISWADENTMGFAGNSVVVSPAAGDTFTVFNANYAGSTGADITLGADGILDIEFYEQGFDDVAGGIDSTYEAGSTITLSGSGFVPTPGSLAVLGLGGLVAGRRRR